MPDFENGVPIGRAVLSYPPTEIDADCTVGTPIHPAYMADSSILKILIGLQLPKQNVV
jgi:hypothetical protein